MGDSARAWSVKETLRSAEALARAGRLMDALELFERALDGDPENAQALYGVGSLAARFGQPERAEKHLRKAIAQNRNVADYHVALSSALVALGRAEEAKEAARRALKLKPSSAEALCNLGCVLTEENQINEALGYLQRAIEIDPKLAIAHQNMGAALFRHGRVNEALTAFRAAVVSDPQFPDSYGGLVKCLNLLPDATPALIAEATRRGARLLPRPRDRAPAANAPVPGRRLRIGYLSPDFRRHPVGIFIKNVLLAYDRVGYEVICYSNNREDDATTAELKALADRWRPIRALDDSEAAALIRSDGIDILVDLAGLTDGNRLNIFLRRPAPVQCTWLGYYATTGVPEIDYIIADRFVVPPGDEALYTEKPWRLPDSYLCYAPPSFPVPREKLPALANGFVTFGSCNNVMKINKLVVRLWTRLLHTVPGSRLLLRAPALSFDDIRNELARQFVEGGIASDRLTLLPIATQPELLATYNAIDIALDPFPYGGGTTTAEALWMGVPVVSLRGDRFTGRVSESILTTIGLPDLVVADDDRYVAAAAALAADLPRLAELRAGLRDKIENSPLCDAPRFARHLEEAYRGMWLAWCHGKEIAA